jgi:hypothetical protein
MLNSILPLPIVDVFVVAFDSITLIHSILKMSLVEVVVAAPKMAVTVWLSLVKRALVFEIIPFELSCDEISIVP